jgi:hypothetical protein
MVDNGDIEAEIFLDYAKGVDAMEIGKELPDEALQAFTRSTKRGCPVSQYFLATYLQREN